LNRAPRIPLIANLLDYQFIQLDHGQSLKAETGSLDLCQERTTHSAVVGDSLGRQTALTHHVEELRDQIGIWLLDLCSRLQLPQEFQPTDDMTREINPQQVDLTLGRTSRSTTQPSIHLGLHLGTRDDFTGSLGQTQRFSKDQGVAGDTSQRSARHLPLGAVREVTATLLGQGTVPLPSQNKRILEESIEHGRTSLDVRRQPTGSTGINSALCWDVKKNLWEITGLKTHPAT
jgi:hypothetical protein